MMKLTLPFASQVASILALLQSEHLRCLNFGQVHLPSELHSASRSHTLTQLVLKCGITQLLYIPQLSPLQSNKSLIRNISFFLSSCSPLLKQTRQKQATTSPWLFFTFVSCQPTVASGSAEGQKPNQSRRSTCFAFSQMQQNNDWLNMTDTGGLSSTGYCCANTHCTLRHAALHH